MAYKLSRLSLARLNGVKAILTAICVDAIPNSPYDFGIAWMGGVRTAVEQHRLFVNKKSKADGYTRISKHQKGLAFDIVCYEDGKITWDEKIFTEVANHILETAKKQYGIELTWGGNWKSFQDKPHFQIAA